MSIFTTVPAESARRWLEGYALGELAGLRGIETGIENTNYFLDTEQGRYVLTLFERLDAATAATYLRLMAHLAQGGVPCPMPVADRQGKLLGQLEGKPAALVTRLPGRSLEAPTAEQCAQAGRLLATLHLAGRDFTEAIANPRGEPWRERVAAEVMPKLAEDDARLLREELAFQAGFRFADLPRGIIHADLFRDNTLFDDGRLSGVLDFYFACHGPWLYDLAIAANDWCVQADGALDGERLQALLFAYHEVRPLTAIERGAWPVMLRAGALRFWLSRLYDDHFPRPGELTYAKDPAHFQRVLRDRVARHDELQNQWINKE